VHDADVRSWLETQGERSIAWAVGVVAGSAAAATATVRGVRGSRVVGGALGGSFAIAVYGSRRIIATAVADTRDRERDQRLLVDAQLGQALGDAHDAINAVEADLHAFLAESEVPDSCVRCADAAIEDVERIAALLRRSAPAREALAGEDGLVPLLGVHAAKRHARGPGPVMPLYGSRTSVPQFVPADLRGAARQLGLVLDELRLRHTAEVERAVLLFTLVSRAVLVCSAPLLGGWTAARAPLAGQLQVRDVVWGAAAAVSLAGAIAAPRIVDLVMQDSAVGRRAGRRLLMVEAPIATLALLLTPTWTVAVFASGAINWWQRQSQGLVFDWRKLAVFVVGVVTLQGAGLAQMNIGLGPAAGEIALALGAIGLTGGSYGAMLPLSIGTGFDVLIGDGRRSLRAVLRARHELLRSARQLYVTAAEIDASAPESPAARRAAATARQAARQLEHAADRAGRRGLVSSHLLVELSAEAIARSFLPRRESRQLEDARQQALDAGEPPPAYATEPIYAPPTLMGARISDQRHARAVRSVIEHSLNEARVHGTKGVRLIVAIDEAQLTVRIGNRPRPGTHGLAGQGGGDLARLASRLPAGQIHRGLQPPATVRMLAGPEWWVVELRCLATVLDCRLEYFLPG
jgi:hypothetical protein